MNDRGASRGAAFAKAQKIRDIRNLVIGLAHAQRLPRLIDHVEVQLHYRPRDSRRRDTDNLVATAKPIYDAFTVGKPAKISARTGRPVPAQPGYGLVFDDTPEFMAKPEPIIWPAVKGEPGKLWVTLTWTPANQRTDNAA
jgi:crossover junction endodeoxyribonuclease RusA